VHVSEEYLRLIDEVEAMPQNQSGRSRLHEAIGRDREYFAAARRLR
jgi:hypothetical protein